MPDPKPSPGYKDWAKWVKGGRKGKRPGVPQQIPRAWWATLEEEMHPKHDAHPPHPAHVPAHA